MRVFVKTWKGSCALTKPDTENVAQVRLEQMDKIVQPWPTILGEPTPITDDARFVKAFPLTFPMGTGDLRQPRLRTDFSPLQWVQHIFRFFTGHTQSSMRGHRV